MSFVFPSWETAFSPSFHEDAKKMLEGALNKGNKPPVIQGRIEVVELSMGKQPPTLTLLEIGDLSLDRFRGILRLGYQGDAWLEVRCRVQANPLSHNPNLLPSSILPLSTPLLASQPLLVPMTIRLSRLNLRAILILVVSASKGITLVFKNDPLQNVEVSSTFDSVEVIRGYLQQEIEGQLREMFREDLPGIIHRLSQTWLGRGGGGKVELPYKDGIDAPSAGLGIPGGQGPEEEDELDPNDPYAEKEIFPPHPNSLSNSNSPNVTTPHRRAVQQAKAARQRRLSSAVSESPTSYTIFPDIEDYDPTYGLRPEGVPTHSGYEAFGRLWEKARQGEGRGFGSLMQTRVEEEGERTGDVSDEEWDGCDINEVDLDQDQVESHDVLSPLNRHMRHDSKYTNNQNEEEAVEWETYPAVGGGVISRPRVYHSQSQIRAPSESGAMPSPGTGSVTARASSIGGASSTIGSLRKFPQHPSTPYLQTQTHIGQAGPGPSSLRRIATSRSDIFTPQHRPTRSEIPLPKSHSYRQLSQPPHRAQAQGQAGTASGGSWSTDHGQTSRSNTMSTPASSQLPSSKSHSMLIAPAHGQTNGHAHGRSMSVTGTSPGKSFPPRNILSGMGMGITLPLNNSVSQLATLSHSNHTLSPYARGHEHIAVRSFPHLGKTPSSSMGAQSRSSSGEGIINGNVKARRKRIHRLGAKKEQTTANSKTRKEEMEPLSPDLDDTPPYATYDSPIPVDRFRRMSFGSTDRMRNGQDYHQQQNQGHSQGQTSLMGMTQRVMRPNMVRSPASRTSYGFPDIG